MNPILRNILAVIAGLVIGGFVNMGIINLSSSIVPLPEGVDPSDVESIKANIHRYSAMHFIMPFLAHALGTLTGAYATARFAANNNARLALIIGGVFLIGGIMMVVAVGGPLWFKLLDILGAYIPMAWLGGKLATNK